MRIALDIISQNKQVIPYSYPLYLRAALLDAISRFDSKLSERLHNDDSLVINFSQLIGYGPKTDKGLEISNARLVVCSPHNEIIKALTDSILDNPVIHVGNVTFDVTNISLLPTLKKECQKIRFKTLSPIIIKNKALERYLYLNETDFSDALEYSIVHRYERTFGKKYSGELTVKPHKETFKKKRVLIKNEYHNCSMGEVTVSAQPELLQFIGDAGLGMKPKFGFGCVEAIKDE